MKTHDWEKIRLSYAAGGRSHCSTVTVIKVIAFRSGGRANTSQDFRVMTPYL